MTTNPLVHAILIAVVCLVSYSNTMHVPFQFDDPYNISEKPYVRDINTFFGALLVESDTSFIMRTATYFTFAVNYWIHGNDVVGYHIVNTIIHLLNGFLVYFLVLLTFRTPYFATANVSFPQSLSPPVRDRGNPSEEGLRTSRSDKQYFIALFAALLFVSHPIQTQAVTYLVQRLASLATFFYLLSLALYITWRLRQVEAKARGGKVSASGVTFYIVSLFAAALAMKTKEIAFTLPFVITLYEMLFFEGPLKKRVLFLAPLLLTMVIIPAALMGITKPAGEVIGDVSGPLRVGTDISRWDYLFTEFRVIVTYIRLLFFPVGQNLDYDYPVYHSFFDPNVFLSFLFLSALFGSALYFLYKSRIDSPGNHRGIAPTTHSLILISQHSSRLIAFGIFWFFVTLSVESSIIPITDVIFEHRLYLPSVGFFIAASALLWMAWQRIEGHGKWVRTAALGMCGLIIVVLSGLTYMRNTVWRTEIGLWEDVAGKSPMKARSYNGLGLAYQNGGRLDEAIGSFAKALSIDPSYAIAYNGLGTAYFKKNLIERAVEEFGRAIALEPENAIFRNNRGLAYAALGEFDGAIADYREAITLDPFYAEAYHNLGFSYHGKGLYGKAIEAYGRAIAIESDNAIYYSNRGLAYSNLRELDRAIADYTKAISLKPDFADAFTGRGIAYGGLGRFDAAVADFSRAVSLAPSSASAYVNRAVAYERMQDITSALSDFQKACDLGDDRGCGGVEYLRKKYRAGK